MRHPALVFAALLALAGCSEESGSAPMAFGFAPDIQWTATAHTGDGDQRAPSASPFHVTFRSDGRIVGNAGCNGFFGEWSTKGDSIAVGPIGITEMACSDRPDWFDMLALFTGDLTPLGGETVTLTTSDGVVISLEPGPVNPPRETSGDPDRPVSTVNEG